MTNAPVRTPARPEREQEAWETPPRRTVAMPRVVLLAGGVLGQLVLGVGATQLAQLAVAHALILTAIACYGLLKRDLLLSVSVLAYLPGSEILWRQARAQIPYQWGPYLAIGISLFCLVLMLGRSGRDGRLAIGFFALLVPASALTIAATGAEAREVISFALAGPMALAMTTAVVAQLRVAAWFYRRLLWLLLVGTLGPLAYALANLRDYVVNTGKIDFGSESNFVTSGGFGPVQVSSVMGLGVLAAVLLVLAESALMPRLLAGVAGTALGVQSLLTFSRGGMISVGIAIAGLTVVLTRDRRSRQRVWAVLALVLVLGYLVVIPRIDSYTEGAFNERFSETSTGRTDLAANDLEIFERNVMFGVGPGMTKFQRLSYEVCELRNDECENEGSSHTEFTRALSEHGLVGAAAIGLLLVLAYRAITRKGPDRGVAVVFMVWAMAQMTYANLRIVAVPIAFAFAFLRVGPEEDPDEDHDEPTGPASGPAPLAPGAL